MIGLLRRLVVAVEGLHWLKYRELMILERQMELVEKNHADAARVNARSEEAETERAAASRRYREYLNRQQVHEDAEANFFQ